MIKFVITMFYYKKNENSKGFTLVELLVVISVIGLLMSVIYTSFTTIRKKSRVAQRVSDMKQVQAALEFYYAANRSYPSTGGAMRSVCASWGGYTANNVIPGLTPLFIPAVPVDPQTDVTNNLNCYIYQSDGVDYAFLDHQVTELQSATPPNYLSYKELIDPARDSGTDPTVVDGVGVWAWKVYSPGAAAW